MDLVEFASAKGPDLSVQFLKDCAGLPMTSPGEFLTGCAEENPAELALGGWEIALVVRTMLPLSSQLFQCIHPCEYLGLEVGGWRS